VVWPAADAWAAEALLEGSVSNRLGGGTLIPPDGGGEGERAPARSVGALALLPPSCTIHAGRFEMPRSLTWPGLLLQPMQRGWDRMTELQGSFLHQPQSAAGGARGQQAAAHC